MGRIHNLWQANRRNVWLIFMYFFVFLLVATLMLVALTSPDKKIKVPSLIGKRFVSVYSTLADSGIKPEIKFYDVYDVEDGVILNQSPQAGDTVLENQKISLVVSRNKLEAEVPSLIGKSLASAQNTLQSLHIGKKSVSLGVGVVSYIPSEKSADNIVLDQSPKAGEKISPNTRINLLVSAGSDNKDKMKMPYITRQSIELVFDLLLAKGVDVNQQIVESNKRNSGKILSQKPYGRQRIARNERVKLKVGYYPSKERLYTGYERITYSIPENEKKGLYLAFIEDDSSKRVRFSRHLKPDSKIDFIFFRKGNARVTIERDKKVIKIFTLNVNAFE
jgi:serine/threonine-protein kinase